MYEGSVTGVNTSILDMLRDVMHNQLPVLSHGIHFDLLGTLNVLRDDDRVFAGNRCGLGEVVREIVRTEYDIHSRTRKNV